MISWCSICVDFLLHQACGEIVCILGMGSLNMYIYIYTWNLWIEHLYIHIHTSVHKVNICVRFFSTISDLTATSRRPALSRFGIPKMTDFFSGLSNVIMNECTYIYIYTYTYTYAHQKNIPKTATLQSHYNHITNTCLQMYLHLHQKCML